MDDKHYRIGVVYKCTNLVNGKIYIGITTTKFEYRKNHHIGEALAGRGYAFHRAIRKYGIENFSWEIIDYADTKEELLDKEVYYISHYNSYIHKENSNGYNLTLGGEGGNGIVRSKESVRKSVLNHPRRREVFQFTLDGDFVFKYESLAEAALEVGGDLTPIYKVCTGKYNYAYGYIWIYEKEFSRELLHNKVLKAKESLPKKVVKCDLLNNLIDVYSCAEDCAKSIKGGCPSTIAKCCRGKCLGANKSHKGFKFYYEDDYYELFGGI